MSSLKTLARSLSQTFGYDIRAADAPLHSMERGLLGLARKIGDSGFVVIDVGVAQGTPELYKAFPPERNKYLLVEADPRYRESLSTWVARCDAAVDFACCGAQPGRTLFNAYADGRKSSMFMIADRPASRVEVEVKPLDDILARHPLPLAAPVVLKIDVEGAEVAVLEGASETLKRCRAVIAEAGFIHRYHDGGALFGDVVALMRDKGFIVSDLVGGGIVDGQLQFVDIIFVPKT